MGTLRDVVRDEAVRHEIATLAENGIPLPGSETLGVSARNVADAVISEPKGKPKAHAATTEAVIRTFGRPVLFVRDGRIELPKSKEISSRILPVKARLEAGIPSVGRIEFSGNPLRSWGGTGWVIDEGVIVTNRHVAELFVERGARGFLAKTNPVTGEPIRARIDFREEFRRPNGDAESFEVAVRKVLFVERDSRKRPDVAFLMLEKNPNLPPPIPVLETDLDEDADVAVVGYPAEDPEGVPSAAVSLRIFQGHFGVKRVAPGRVMVSEPNAVFFSHDATTLGGNSGSAVLDMQTGAAAGLHFMGDLGVANFAVKATALRDELARARKGRQPKARVPAPVPRPDHRPGLVESAPADYADRQGFDSDFLGAGKRVDLPVKQAGKSDLLTFTDLDGKKQSVLKYTHYSVAMSVSRKQCLWSAVNIDGATSKSDKRPGSWLIDPRIPASAQTLPDDHDKALDVYGNAPRFARGHMTRREDPAWGETDLAHKGNVDSMHYTNAVPQQQAFNAPIWLRLEDYALQHARADKMRISVITGPIFLDSDPTMFGARIPVEFWKVIAFIHDETGKLTATGYSMSQESQLPHEEFVFGPFDNTSQIQLKTIERRTGLSFGTLSSRDPKRGEEAVPQPISALEQIRFV
jgi:endonuclease G